MAAALDGYDANEHRRSAALSVIAALSIIANVFLTSPPRFSDRPWPEGSLLRPVVELLGLYAAFPTPQGVEIRTLVFSLGSGTLLLAAGLFAVAGRRRRALSGWTEIDLDALARTPVAWWTLLLALSALSTAFSHAPRVAWGGFVIRAWQFAWFVPLATMLTPRDAARLAGTLVVAVAGVAALGIWYQAVRAIDPSGRLSYPFGNEGWMGACLLPGAVIAAAFATFGGRGGRREWLAWRPLALLATGVIVCALVMTGTRSALAGLAVAAVTALFLRLGRRPRLAILVLLGVAVAWFAWLARARGIDQLLGERAASIRSRVEHEWPLALRLIRAKPIMGHGEGGYAMLAGGLARDRQFDEPAITAIDRAVPGVIHGVWPDHAHNEYLELAVDIGLVGAAVFVAALVITLRRAMKAADDPRRVTMRGWSIALAAALAGLAADLAFSVAVRNPGLPPILLTVWGCLWAVIRPRRAPTACETSAVDRFAGRRDWIALGAPLVAVALAWLGAQDWRAALARHRADASLAAGRAAEAVAAATRAAAHALDPFRRLLAELSAARAQSELAQNGLRRTGDPDAGDLIAGREALRLIERLDRAAPRFLWVARMRADVAMALASAHERLAQASEVRYYREVAAAALLQQCRDEPFDPDALGRLLQYAPVVSTLEVLRLARGPMREGPVDERWDRAFAAIRARRDFREALAELRSVADADEARPPERWSDRLAPETLRLMARAYFETGDREQAIRLCQRASAMYERVGARLLGAQIGAMTELCQYRFAEAPQDAADLLPVLQEIARMRLTLGLATDQRDPVGRLRAMVVLAARGEPALRDEFARGLATADGGPDTSVGRVHVRLARFLLDRAPGAERKAVFAWATRGAELLSNEPAAWLCLAEAGAEAGEWPAAREALERFERVCPDREVAERALAEFQRRHPQFRAGDE